MSKSYYVYILTNKHHTVFYIGISCDLERRMSEHLNKSSYFTSKYNITKLVYLEIHGFVYDAISREKQIKKWARAKKIFLIEKMNPDWNNLFEI